LSHDEFSFFPFDVGVQPIRPVAVTALCLARLPSTKAPHFVDALAQWLEPSRLDLRPDAARRVTLAYHKKDKFALPGQGGGSGVSLTSLASDVSLTTASMSPTLTPSPNHPLGENEGDRLISLRDPLTARPVHEVLLGRASRSAVEPCQSVALRVRLDLSTYYHVLESSGSGGPAANELVVFRAVVPPPFQVEPSHLQFKSGARNVDVTVSLRPGAATKLAGRTAIGFLCVVATNSVIMKSIPVRSPFRLGRVSVWWFVWSGTDVHFGCGVNRCEQSAMLLCCCSSLPPNAWSSTPPAATPTCWRR